jgi:hypothetical protein
MRTSPGRAALLATVLSSILPPAAHAAPDAAQALARAVLRDPARAGTAIAVAPPGGEDVRPARGVARTAVAHRFDRPDLQGAVGFLCGLQPSVADTAGSAVFGRDPHGRFVGAQLTLAFR